MPIVPTDILLKQSSDSNLGGAVTASDVSTELHGLFDVVSGVESAAGDIEYRCIYVKNNHASLTLYNAVAFIQENTPSVDTACDIGVGTAAINAVEPTIANEGTAPVDVVFSAPSTFGTGLPLGDLPPGAVKSLWIRRTINVGAAAFNTDGVTLAIQGDTAA